MKISELINALSNAETKYGDLIVRLPQCGNEDDEGNFDLMWDADIEEVQFKANEKTKEKYIVLY